jgi:uncharacterized protein YecT (DUF1311 family)
VPIKPVAIHYYDPDGGSMARLSANDCMMMSTAMRAKELENLARN